jgi:hypothetical protein
VKIAKWKLQNANFIRTPIPTQGLRSTQYFSANRPHYRSVRKNDFRWSHVGDLDDLGRRYAPQNEIPAIEDAPGLLPRLGAHVILASTNHVLKRNVNQLESRQLPDRLGEAPSGVRPDPLEIRKIRVNSPRHMIELLQGIRGERRSNTPA